MTRARHTHVTVFAIISAFSVLHCGGDQKPAEAAPSPPLEPAELSPAPASGPGAAPGTAPGSGTADPPAAPASTPADAAGKSATPKPDALSDEQIAGVTDALTSAELAQSKIAQLKSKNDQVKRFSAAMIAHFSDAKQKQDKLKLSTADSALSTEVGTASATSLNELKKLTGAAFDLAYINAQVDQHQRLLSALDGQLLPNVKNPDLKAFLDGLKPHVADRLKEAQDIQRGLASK